MWQGLIGKLLGGGMGAGELGGLAKGMGGGSPFNGSGAFKSFGGLGTGGGGGMTGGELAGSLKGSSGGAGKASGPGGSADMGQWAFQYYTPYENRPQADPSQMMGLFNFAQNLANNQQPRQPIQTMFTPQQGMRNNYLQMLLHGGR